MPGTDFSNQNVLWGSNLLSAVSSGAVSEPRLDNVVTRILAAWYIFRQDQGYPSIGRSSCNGGSGAASVASTHKTVVRSIAGEGIVLLKNRNNILPLSNPSGLAVIGSDSIVGCDTTILGMGWGSGPAEYRYFVAPLDTIKTAASGRNDRQLHDGRCDSCILGCGASRLCSLGHSSATFETVKISGLARQMASAQSCTIGPLSSRSSRRGELGATTSKTKVRSNNYSRMAIIKARYLIWTVAAV